MTQLHEDIFRKALVSNNPQAILNVGKAFNGLGDATRGCILIERAEIFRGIMGVGGYGFGVDYGAVQKKLNELGASPKLDVDGKWGAKSKAALVAYQKSKGLAADGIPGPLTLGAMGVSTANETASSTMGSVTPAVASADAKAYAVGKKAGAEMGLTEKEVQYVVAVARGEGYYGGGWGNPSKKTIEESQKFGITGYEGKGSNNWGAVQGTGNGGKFPHVDHDAKGKAYLGYYKKYLAPEDGFKDMAKTILGGGPKRKAVGAAEIKAAINKGNLKEAVFAQHANGYFELAPEKYLSAVMSNYSKIANSIGWPKILSENGITPGIAAVAGGGGLLLLGLGALGVYLFRKPLGLVR